ncbi:hypothetical protein [Candidatus Thioglobus sp.]|uniref:hypothetical protein n=1 Tax=Candidatus Thioglobus sp. TaxID=2026721 RepID=UPI003D0B1810
MKITHKILPVAALILTAQMAQAHITVDAVHLHEGAQLRGVIQPILPAHKLHLRGEERKKFEDMSVEERRIFNNRIRLNRVKGHGHAIHNGPKHGGYGRGYGKR